MSPEAYGPAGFVLVVVLIAFRVPVALAMALVGTIGAILLGGWSKSAYILGNLPFEAVSSDGMEVVPLFIFMGVFAAYSGMSRNLYGSILVVTVAVIGLITPPIGMNLFVIQGVAPGLRIATVMRGIVPFILADVVRIGLMIAFPALALFVPRALGF